MQQHKIEKSKGKITSAGALVAKSSKKAGMMGGPKDANLINKLVRSRDSGKTSMNPMRTPKKPEKSEIGIQSTRSVHAPATKKYKKMMLGK